MVKDNHYWNKDIEPTPVLERNWNAKDFLILWIAMSATVVTYMCGSSLIEQGMNWWEALLTVFLGSVLVVIPIILNAHVGVKYGIPFPVYCRVSFGLRGANLPVLLRAFVACGWFGIVCWIGGGAIYDIVVMFFPASQKLPNSLLGSMSYNLDAFSYFGVFIFLLFVKE